MGEKRQQFLAHQQRNSTFGSLIGLDAFVNESDIRDIFKAARDAFNFDARNVKHHAESSQKSGTKETIQRKGFQKLIPSNNALGVVAIALLPLAFFLSSFMVIIPMLHGVGGHLFHNKEGWRFFQPGKGGVRFMALNGMAWTILQFDTDSAVRSSA